ncbi:MAG: ABC transporter substrate-binding protein [Burkholderiales bacterium]|nr:ABC transporter substrate-binding protein [Burkholderiales bacterium]
MGFATVLRGLAAPCLLACATASLAGQGIDAASITFVQAADISGSRSALTLELNAGTMAYFSQVNSQGGVHGRQLRLKTVDDGYAVKRTEQVTREWIEHDDVFAFVSSIGTANAEAVLPLINAARVPLVAPLSGAISLREPFSRYVFHSRSSYAQEVEKMVEHVLTIGISRVAVFYDDDAFGQDVRRGVEEALARRKLKAVASGKVERGSSDVTQAVKAIAAARPQVVICGSFGKSLVEFIKAMKLTAVQPQFYALSFFTAGASITQLGNDARGIGVTQVMPKPNATNLPIVREFHAAMAKYAPESRISYISLEGYVTGKILAEGLRRAGRGVTREKFVDALEGMRNVDLGGVFLSYSPTDHSGLKRVEITVIDGAGQVLQ